jgi:Fur family ferric uptake transcriptional regulator
MVEPEAERLVRGASLRVTRPRIAVLSVIHEVPHQDVGTITRLVRKRIGAVSTQTVYGNLDALVEARLARRIDLPGSPALYEGQTWDDHLHAVCRDCGVVTDVDGPPGGIGLPTTHVNGFAIDGVDVTFRGVCPDCQAEGRRRGPKPAQTEFTTTKE